MFKHQYIAALGFGLRLGTVSAWWQPAVGTTWQITLSEPPKNINLNVDAYDFDLFDTTADKVAAIQANGHKAICYFSAGSWERWRRDAGEFNKTDLGKPLAHWPGERWLNTNSEDVRTIMGQRMDLAVQNGCDAIDPDNIDAYDNGGGGFGLTKADAIDYVKFLASEGHRRGLAVGLKNGGAIISSVLSDVEFSVNEQCERYHECSTFRPFLDAGKPVFHIEYAKGTPPSSTVNKICSNASSQGFSTLIKHLSLDEWVLACPSGSKPKRQRSTPSTLHSKKAPNRSSNKTNQNSSNKKTWIPFATLGSGLAFCVACFW